MRFRNNSMNLILILQAESKVQNSIVSVDNMLDITVFLSIKEKYENVHRHTEM